MKSALITSFHSLRKVKTTHTTVKTHTLERKKSRKHTDYSDASMQKFTTKIHIIIFYSYNYTYSQKVVETILEKIKQKAAQMKQKHDFGPREREIRAVTHRTRRRERPGQNHTHTHTGLESRPIHDHQRNATNEKRNDLQNGTTSFCRLFFSYRASQTKKAPQSRFESREGLPACLRKVCFVFVATDTNIVQNQVRFKTG